MKKVTISFILFFIAAIAIIGQVFNTSVSTSTSSASAYSLAGASRKWIYTGSSNVQWRMVKNYTLTNVADVSACAYYPSNNTIWTTHNNANGRITEWTLDGQFIRKIDGTGSQAPDAEAFIWMYNNTFALVDEDNNRIFIMSITNNASGSTWDSNNTQIVQLNTNIGKDPPSGVEGLAWDPNRNGWWVAREKTPAQLLFCSADGQTTNNFFGTAGGSPITTFTNANHTDFSDLFLDVENDVLWVAQDENNQFDRVLAISLVNTSIVVSLTVTNFGQLEGISLMPDGRLLLTGEVNQFAIFEPQLSGRNSGISWEKNAATNDVNVPSFPRGFSVGPTTTWTTNILSASATLDFASTLAQNSANLTITVTGAADGDPVFVGVPNGSYNANTDFSAYVSAANTVTVRFNNYSAGAVDPASGTYRVVVFKIQ